MDFTNTVRDLGSVEQSQEFASHMAEETVDAPAAVRRALNGNREALRQFAKEYRTRRPAYLLTSARGSSDHAAGYFKYLSEIVLGLPCCSIGPSVVSIYGAHLSLRDSMLITVSQSGRSPDILSCQAEAKRAGIPTIAVTNDERSPLARDADLCLPLGAGPELSVAATKTFIGSAALLAAMIAACTDDRALEDGVARLPDDLEQALGCRWDAVEDTLAVAQSLYVLGRGPSLAMAREGAQAQGDLPAPRRGLLGRGGDAWADGAHRDGFSGAGVRAGGCGTRDDGSQRRGIGQGRGACAHASPSPDTQSAARPDLDHRDILRQRRAAVAPARPRPGRAKAAQQGDADSVK